MIRKVRGDYITLHVQAYSNVMFGTVVFPTYLFWFQTMSRLPTVAGNGIVLFLSFHFN
jgi:hypothetical protein